MNLGLATSVTLTNVTISGNTATLGGGIANSGRLVMTGSTVSGNQANGVDRGPGRWHLPACHQRRGFGVITSR